MRKLELYEKAAAYILYPGTLLGAWITSWGWRTGKIEAMEGHFTNPVWYNATGDVFIAATIGPVIFGFVGAMLFQVAKSDSTETNAEGENH